MSLKKKILFDILLIIIILSFGTIGYITLEKWPVLDAFYMTLITLTTIGYGEIHPLSSTGRIFTIILILSGLGTIMYAIGSISTYVFREKIYSFIQERTMKSKIQSLKNHFIICGASDTSLTVMQELALEKIPFVLIDLNENRIKKAVDKTGCLYIHGDATNEENLKEAQIQSAEGLIASLHDDHSNVYLIMAAREHNKSLTIYAKVKEESSRKKLILAGADHIINPYDIGGMRMASMIIRPSVVKFLDNLLNNQNRLEIEEITIDQGSKWENKTVDIHDVEKNLKAHVLALKKKNEKAYRYHFENDKMSLEKGDCLFILQKKRKK